MKAIIYERYGSPDVLTFREIPKPAPADNEVLIKVLAASLNAADWHLMRGAPYFARFTSGLIKPKIKILGADVAGIVESVGSAVTLFKPGDEVFADLSAGFSSHSFGGFAEYVVSKEKTLVFKPKDLSFLEAAAIPLAATTALQGLRKGKITAGQKVLINGASGGVGTFAVQIAKAFGAHVTAVCSTAKIEMVRALGADNVIDYTQKDFTQGNKKYDVILAANGYHPITHYKRVLAQQGKYVLVGGTMRQFYEAMALGVLLSEKKGRTLQFHAAASNRDDLLFLKDLAESGKIKPMIEKVYELNEVPIAMKYLEEGHAIGKLVVKIRREAIP